MKKLFLFIALAFTLSSFGQLYMKQIAFGGKGFDSISGATSKYYYFNYLGTKAAGLVKSTTANIAYEVVGAQAMVVHPLVYTAADSMHLTWEISFDNVNWVKWTNAGATSVTTQTQWKNGGPKIVGSNGKYLYGDDLVSITTSDAGAIWYFNGCMTPYLRLSCVRYKETSASYVQAWVLLKRF